MSDIEERDWWNEEETDVGILLEPLTGLGRLVVYAAYITLALCSVLLAIIILS